MRVLMMVENNPYPQDPRVRNEATTLVRAGHELTVIAPRARGQPRHDHVEGVRVYRYAAPPSVPGVAGYLVEYGLSLAAMLVLASWVAVRHGVDVVHAHNPPDLLVLIGALLRPFGVRYVFDVHDLSPEMYQARFRTEATGVLYRALLAFEQLSFRLADHVIATNASYAEVARLRGRVPAERVTIVRNGPDLVRVRRVAPDERLRAEARHLIGYVGVMGPQDGVDYLLRALAHLRDRLGVDPFLCVIVGRGDALAELRTLSRELGLDEHVRFAGYVPDDELMSILSTVDVFVAPEPSNAFNDKSTMIKLTEYLVFGRPIVAFDLPEHRVTAGDAALYATPNDELAFAQRIAEALRDEGVRARVRTAAAERLATFTWAAQEPSLLKAYAALAVRAGRGRTSDRRP